MNAKFTSNLTDLVRKALRNGGYLDDSREVVKAEVKAVTVSSPAVLAVIISFYQSTGVAYLSLDAEGKWIAEY